MDLSQWVKSRRKDLKLNQTEAGKLIGLTQGQFSMLERGDLKVTSELEQQIRTKLGGDAPPVITTSGEPIEQRTAIAAALEARAKKREQAFHLDLDDKTYVTADANQYILHHAGQKSYFVDINVLMKHLIGLKVRMSAVSNFEEVITCIKDTFKVIDEKFSNYDPANVRVSREVVADEENED